MNNNETFQSVVKLLLQGGSYTTKELSEKFEVNVKTIQNYFKELRENSGLVKDGTKYYFSDEFRNVDIHERVQMSTALMIALYKKAIPELKDSVTYNFKELPKELDAFVFDIDFQSIENENLFAQIVDAILKKESISFGYTNLKDSHSIKNIYPIKVTNMQGFWYLLGFDLEAQKVKTFYMKNIESLTKLDDDYLSPKDMQNLKNKMKDVTSPWFNEDIKTVTLHVSGDASRYFKRANSCSILQEHNNTLTVSMNYYNDIEVLSTVQKWLPDITIVDNQELIEKLKIALKSSLNSYN